MEYVRSNIILSGLLSNFTLTITDLNNLKKVNHDFNTTLKDKQYCIQSIKHNHEIFYKILETNNVDIISSCIKSNINILNLDKILYNFIIVNNRNYGDKYGYLLKTPISCQNKIINNIEVKINTLNILLQLYKYSVELQKIQKKAPTELSKYPLYWSLDYIKYIIKQNNSDIQYNMNIMDIHIDNDKIFTSITNIDINIIKLYEILIYSFNHNIDNNWKNNNQIYVKTEKLFILYTEIFMHFIYTHIITYEFRNIILLQFMRFILNIIKNGFISIISHHLLNIVKEKINEFIQDTIDKKEDVYVLIRETVLELQKLLL